MFLGQRYASLQRTLTCRADDQQIRNSGKKGNLHRGKKLRPSEVPITYRFLNAFRVPRLTFRTICGTQNECRSTRTAVMTWPVSITVTRTIKAASPSKTKRLSVRHTRLHREQGVLTRFELWASIAEIELQQSWGGRIVGCRTCRRCGIGHSFNVKLRGRRSSRRMGYGSSN
jgi:hypothetical protein